MATRSKGTTVTSEHPRFNANTCQEHCSHYHSNQKVVCTHPSNKEQTSACQRNFRGVRLLQPVLAVFAKKETASVNKVRNQQHLHPYSAMVNASPEREWLLAYGKTPFQVWAK